MCAGSHDIESGCLQQKQPSLGSEEFSQIKKSSVEMALMSEIQTAVLSGSAGQCGSEKSHDTL